MRVTRIKLRNSVPDPNTGGSTSKDLFSDDAYDIRLEDGLLYIRSASGLMQVADSWAWCEAVEGPPKPAENPNSAKAGAPMAKEKRASKGART